MPLSTITNPFLDPAGSARSNVYSPSANTIGIVTSGTEAVRVDSSGNMGIGTSSPAYRIDVVTSSVDNGVRITAGNTGGNLFLKSTSASGKTYRLYSTGSSNVTGSGYFGVFDEDNGLLRLSVSPNGYVNLPYQPAFSASRQAGDVDNGTTVIWDSVALNRTSSYNASNGRFTAPIAGVYAFWWRGDNSAVNGSTSSTSGLQMSIRINGTDNSNSWGWTGNNTGGHASGFLIIQLSVSDYVEVRNQNYGKMQGTPGYNNGFGGYLIG